MNNSLSIEKTTIDHLRIKRILFACMVLVPFLPFMMVLFTGYYYFSTSLEKNAIDSMKRILQDHQTIVASFLKERQASLNLILNTNRIDAFYQAGHLQKIYETLKQNDQAFTDIGVFDAEGNHLAYQGPYQNLLGQSYKNTTWFRMVQQNGHYVSDVFLGYRKAPHFIVAAARTIAGKSFVLRATIDMRIFNELVESVHIGKTGEAFIINEEGIVQTKDASVGSILTKAKYDLPLPSAGESVITKMQTSDDGQKYIYAAVRIKDTHWLLVVKQNSREVFSALRRTILITAFIAVLGGFLIIGLAVYATNRIFRTLTRLQIEKNSAQYQLIRAGRLSELGQMAAGFAHEINNPLQIITSEQTLIRSNLNELIAKGDIPPSEMMTETMDSVEQIKIQISRCAKITQAILKFARKDEPKTQRVNLRELVPEILSLIERKAQVNGIVIAQTINPDLPDITADASQLQQVLLNLLNNSMDAIIEKGNDFAGKLTVIVNTDTNNAIEIQIMDNGIGIDDVDKEKIFSPFFTTKPPGKGTGLGLSVCFAIIQSMRGSLLFTSEKGGGTIFTIRLPVI